ncbi:hypothetical protein MMC31_003171 [Peltigera leucophlebia]|nr:hypothetical protein [Peltigera leucophlebia]
MATQTPTIASPPTATTPAVAKLVLPSLEALKEGVYIRIFHLKYEALRPVLPSPCVDPGPPPSLGNLEALPNELLTMIIKNLSISSLSALDSTNQPARDFVNSIRPALAHVNGQAPQILEAAAALDLPYSIEVLDKLLQENKCFWCRRKPGYYLSLLEQRIYCWGCLEYEEWLPCDG